MFPNYDAILTEFDKMISWKKTSGGKLIPEPVKGMNEEFDKMQETVVVVKNMMNEYAKEIAEKLDASPDEV